jgi:glutamate 5-kinase
MKAERMPSLQGVRRVTVKIGSSLLADPVQRRIQNRFLGRLASQVDALKRQGVQTVIVTSGAIAAGLFELGLDKKPKEMARLQALAALGQSSLMHAYAAAFRKFGLRVAQVLLTREDLSDRRRYSNAHGTFQELFRNGIVPVVNENDTVAVEEIKFGDNDTLGMLVAHLSESDLLVLLTDTDGFFHEDPRVNPKAERIGEVHRLDDALKKKALHSGSQVGTGGMQTKIRAAQNMMRSGIPMVIAGGRTPSVLEKILEGRDIGTFFHPLGGRMASRKRWLAWSADPRGEITVDEGARKALLAGGKSLLPSGVESVKGLWDAGDRVRIVDAEGREIAVGLSAFSSRDLDRIKGMKSAQAAQVLGPGSPVEAVHKDNLALLETD